MQDLQLQPAMKAAILHKGKLLILREAKTDVSSVEGLYQLPGGRVNPGEHFKEALQREVIEETGLTVEVQIPIYVGEWRPTIRGQKHQIIATFFAAKTTTDKVTLSEEHDSFIWIKPSDYKRFLFADPETEVIEALIKIQEAGLLN